MLTPSRRLKIGLSLAAAALLGTLWVRPVFAEETGSGHGDSKSSTSGETSGARSSGGEDNAGGATKSDAPGKDVNSAAPAGGNANDIDTRISVQPRHPGARPVKSGTKNTIATPSLQNMHRPTFSAPRASRPLLRNAVGVRVTPRESAEHGLARPNSVGPSRGISSGPSIGAARNSPAGTTVVPGTIGSRITNFDHRVPGTTVTAPAVNHGAINGTGVARRNLGPSQVGGPKVSSTGINGTTIKPRRGF
jgi:hypothetical protein